MSVKGDLKKPAERSSKDRTFVYRVCGGASAKKQSPDLATKCMRLWDRYHHLFFMVNVTTGWVLYSIPASIYFSLHISKRFYDYHQQNNVYANPVQLHILYVMLIELLIPIASLHCIHWLGVCTIYKLSIRRELADSVADRFIEGRSNEQMQSSTAKDVEKNKAPPGVVIVCQEECMEESPEDESLEDSRSSESKSTTATEQTTTEDKTKEKEPMTKPDDSKKKKCRMKSDKSTAVVGLLRSKAEDDNIWSMWDCVVDPCIRKQRIGLGLLEMMEREAIKYGVEKLICIVLSPPAKRMCVKFGMTRTNYPYCLCPLWPTTYEKKMK